MKPILSLLTIFLLAGCACRPLCQGRAAGCPPTPVAAGAAADTAAPCGCQHVAKAGCGHRSGGAPAPCAQPCGSCPKMKSGDGGGHGPGCGGGPARMHKMMQHKMQYPAEAEKFFQEDQKE